MSPGEAVAGPFHRGPGGAGRERLRDGHERLIQLGRQRMVGEHGQRSHDDRLDVRAELADAAVERTEAEEGAAYGAALLGAVAGGTFADAHEAVSACVRTRDRIEPDPRWQARYDEGYAQYRRLYPTLRRLQ